MKELELKFLEIDVDALVKKLKAVGATLNVDGVLRTIYFDRKDGSILEADEIFRIRTFGDKVELCRKINPRLEDGCKVYDEIEVHVSDYDTAVELVESLGYVKGLVFEKKRLEYKLRDGVKFEIDEFPGIPVFLEIEAPSMARIQELIEEFDLSSYEQTHLCGQALIGGKYGVDVNGLVF